MNKDIIFKKLINCNLTKLNRTCNLIMLTFQNANNEKTYLHIQCYMRIFKFDKLILSTENLYEKGNKYKFKFYKKFNYSKIGETLYDDIIEKIKVELLNSKLISINDKNNDLILYFDNAFQLEILCNVSIYDKSDYIENYRIFNNDKSIELVI